MSRIFGMDKYLRDISDIEPLPEEGQLEILRDIRAIRTEAAKQLVYLRTNRRSLSGEEIDRIRKDVRSCKEKMISLRNNFAVNHLRFVITIAKQYQGRGLSLEDLIGAGNVGLLRAIERFDENRGVKFITYAVSWIRQTILTEIAEVGRTIRLPVNKIKRLYRVRKSAESLRDSDINSPTIADIAEDTDLTEEQVRDVLRVSHGTISLDAPVGDESAFTLLDLMVSPNPDPEEELAIKIKLSELDEVLLTLKKREFEIIKLYFGLGGEEPLTLEEIGERFGVTKERIRQIIDKVIVQKFQHPVNLRRLRHASGISEESALPNPRSVPSSDVANSASQIPAPRIDRLSDLTSRDTTAALVQKPLTGLSYLAAAPFSRYPTPTGGGNMPKLTEEKARVIWKKFKSMPSFATIGHPTFKELDARREKYGGDMRKALKEFKIRGPFCGMLEKAWSGLQSFADILDSPLSETIPQKPGKEEQALDVQLAGELEALDGVAPLLASFSLWVGQNADEFAAACAAMSNFPEGRNLENVRLVSVQNRLKTVRDIFRAFRSQNSHNDFSKQK